MSNSRRRILVVDDNAGATRMLDLLLRKLGDHDVFMAHDGASALETAWRERPDMILLDIGLPRLDGYEVARQLRAQPEFDRTLLVALTAFGTEQDRLRSTEVGFDEHVVKPPSVQILERLLAHPRLSRKS
jgi:CheY-like chemotaxis protein